MRLLQFSRWFCRLPADLGKRFSAILLGLLMLSAFPITAAENSRLEKVLLKKELRACIWPEYYSITYRNPKTRKLTGIDIVITQELARELGVKIRYVDSNFAQLFESLEQDRCDIATHAVGITPERLARLQFSQAYLKSGLFAVTLKNKEGLQSWDSLDQNGRVIAVAAGTLMEGVMTRSLKKARLMKVQALTARPTAARTLTVRKMTSPPLTAPPAQVRRPSPVSKRPPRSPSERFRITSQTEGRAPTIVGGVGAVARDLGRPCLASTVAQADRTTGNNPSFGTQCHGLHQRSP